MYNRVLLSNVALSTNCLSKIRVSSDDHRFRERNRLPSPLEEERGRPRACRGGRSDEGLDGARRLRLRTVASIWRQRENASSPRFFQHPSSVAFGDTFSLKGRREASSSQKIFIHASSSWRDNPAALYDRKEMRRWTGMRRSSATAMH